MKSPLATFGFEEVYTHFYSSKHYDFFISTCQAEQDILTDIYTR